MLPSPPTQRLARTVAAAVRAGRYAALAGVVAATLVAPSAARADEDDGILCGVVDPLDPLLGCTAAPPPPPPPPPPGEQEPGPAAPTAAAPSPDGSAAIPTPAPPAPAASAARGIAPPRVPTRPRYVANQLLVKFERRASKRQIRTVLRRAGVAVEETIEELGVRVVNVPPDRLKRALTELRSSPLVDTAERDAVLYPLETRPNDGVWPEQWGLQQVGLPVAWDITRGSSTVIVAVVDTGVDAGHPDLAGAVLPGVDLVNGDGDATDDHGHGTSVAGIIAARTNNAQGQAGVCWTCSILPVKVLSAGGSGSMSLLAGGIVAAVDRGARVINLSLGGPAGSETLAEAVAYAVSKGVVLVGAAGNNGTSSSFYPAAYPGVISVAATDDVDHLYPWSNYGPWVQVGAPGCNVATILGGGYDHVCGTSTAAPVVSGLVALALSAKPAATAAEIDNALIGSGIAVEGGPRRVDATGMLTVLGVNAPPPPRAPAGPTSVTLRGKLTPRAATRAYPIATLAGRLTATVTFTGGRQITLSVVSETGVPLARVTGKSPLRLDHAVPAGALRVVVQARARGKFTLRLTFPAA